MAKVKVALSVVPDGSDMRGMMIEFDGSKLPDEIDKWGQYIGGLVADKVTGYFPEVPKLRQRVADLSAKLEAIEKKKSDEEAKAKKPKRLAE